MKPATALCIISMGILMLALYSPHLAAEVSVQRAIRTGGGAAAEVHEIDYFKGTMKRTDSKMRFTGRVVGMLIRPKDHSTIYNVEEDLVMEVNHANKTYSERRISLAKEKRSDLEGGEGTVEGVEMEHVGEKEVMKVMRSEFSVRETGEKKTINGFHCRRYVLKWIVETENVMTKDRNRKTMTGDFWNTPEEGEILQLMEEENYFNRAYLEKLGLEITPGEMKKFGAKLLRGILSAGGADLKKAMEKMKGYPIVSSIRWEADRDDEGEGTDEGTETEKSLEGGKRIPGRPFKMKTLEKEEKQGGNLELLFESYTEIEGIDTSPLPDSHFEVPKEYKKVSGAL